MSTRPNIFIYSFDNHAKAKQTIAIKLINQALEDQLYTEDLHDGHRLFPLSIINPFKKISK